MNKCKFRLPVTPDFRIFFRYNICLFRGHSIHFHAEQDPFQDYRFFREQGEPGTLSPVMGAPTCLDHYMFWSFRTQEAHFYKRILGIFFPTNSLQRKGLTQVPFPGVFDYAFGQLWQLTDMCASEKCHFTSSSQVPGFPRLTCPQEKYEKYSDCHRFENWGSREFDRTQPHFNCELPS